MFSSACWNAVMLAASLPEKIDLEVEPEVADDRLVELDVRRVRAEELARAAGLAGGEVARVVVQVVPVEDVRVLLGEPRRDEPADDPDVAVRAEVRRAAVTGALEELLLQVRVAPVLDDHVHLAGAEALPGDVLLELLVGDRAADRLGDRAHDVRARLVADPRVDRHVDVAASSPASEAEPPPTRSPRSARRSSRPVVAAAREHERRARRDRSQARPLLPSDPRVPHSISSVVACAISCCSEFWVP